MKIDIPDFLKRTPGDARTVFAPKPVHGSVSVMGRNSNGIHPSLGPLAEANIMRLRKLMAKDRARATVLKAIQGGADTFGKIRKVTNIEDDSLIRSALRRYVNAGRVTITGKRYTTWGEPE